MMLQRLKWLKDVVGLCVNRQKGMELLDRIESSDLSAADRARVSHMLRTMLPLPNEPGQAPSSPEVLGPSTPASRRGPRPSA